MLGKALQRFVCGTRRLPVCVCVCVVPNHLSTTFIECHQTESIFFFFSLCVFLGGLPSNSTLVSTSGLRMMYCPRPIVW